MLIRSRASRGGGVGAGIGMVRAARGAGGGVGTELFRTSGGRNTTRRRGSGATGDTDGVFDAEPVAVRIKAVIMTTWIRADHRRPCR
jgi:hypothetical protein